MPVGGFVISVHPDDIEPAILGLERIRSLEISGHDESGNIVAVIESDTSEEMDVTVRNIMNMKYVLNVGLAYLNAEDEIEKIRSGELLPGKPSGKS